MEGTRIGERFKCIVANNTTPALSSVESIILESKQRVTTQTKPPRMLQQKTQYLLAIAVALAFLGGCDSRAPAPAIASAPANHADPAQTEPSQTNTRRISTGPEEGDEWEYEEGIDPITKAVSHTAKRRIAGETETLVADIEFHCESAQGGKSSFLRITTYDRSQQVGDVIPPAPINEAAPIEYRLNGQPRSISLPLLYEISTPSGFNNQVRLTFRQLSLGLLDSVTKAGDYPLFVKDPEFVVRLATQAGNLTHQMSLEAPAVKKVLTACEVRFGTAAEEAAAIETLEQEKEAAKRNENAQRDAAAKAEEDKRAAAYADQMRKEREARLNPGVYVALLSGTADGVTIYKILEVDSVSDGNVATIKLTIGKTRGHFTCPADDKDCFVLTGTAPREDSTGLYRFTSSDGKCRFPIDPSSDGNVEVPELQHSGRCDGRDGGLDTSNIVDGDYPALCKKPDGSWYRCTEGAAG